MDKLDRRDAALVGVGRELQSRGYRFITVTPATHARVNARPDNQLAASLEDIFGWSRAFSPAAVPERMLELLHEGEAIEQQGNLCRATVRFSTHGDLIFAHSAFPTTSADSVFFGPDTYRFANALRAAHGARAANDRALRIVDIGCGSGAGGIYLRSLYPAKQEVEVVLGDINPAAVRFAAINAELNHCAARAIESDVFSGLDGAADLIIANPPYLVDAAERVYRHGGGKLGFDLALRIVDEAVPRLAPGGQLILYTGAPVVAGVDKFREALGPRLSDCPFTYQEIDPDVFGEELVEPDYATVDRIAAVVLIVSAPGGDHHERHAHGPH